MCLCNVVDYLFFALKCFKPWTEFVVTSEQKAKVIDLLICFLNLFKTFICVGGQA